MNHKRSNRLRRAEQGFTLLEVLIVVIILGLLAALVTPKLFGTLGKAKSQVAKTQIELVAGALDRYRLDVGNYPATADGLAALIERPAGAVGWAGPYLKKGVPKDPWDNDYQYASPGQHGDYDLYSLGRDKAEGGEDEDADVVSWQ